MGIIKNIGYKYRVLMAITLFLIVTVVAFGTLFIKGFIDRNSELRSSELVKDTENMISSIDSTLMTLHKYYLASESNEEVRYITENDVDYNQVSAITEGTDTLSGNNIVSDYVSAYTLVNFKTGTVLGSRGRYSTDQVVNLDRLIEIYETYKETYTKNLWIYVSDDAPDKYSREYRMTVPISGLDLVLFTPYSEITPYSLVVINVNLNQITSELRKQLGENEQAALYTSDGKLIYTTDDDLVDVIDKIDLLSMSGKGFIAQKSAGKKLYLSKGTISVAGLVLVVSYANDSLDIYAGTYQILGFILVILLMFFVATLVFKSIYSPIKTAVNEISNSSEEHLRPGEDELKFLTNSVKRLDNKNEALIKHTANLFAMRLYRNELTNDEIDQYVYRLSLSDKIPASFRILTFVLKMTQEDKVITEDDEKRICTEIIKRAMQSIGDKDDFLPAVYYSRAIVVFLNGDDSEQFKEYVIKQYNYIRQYVYNDYQMNIGVGISMVHRDIHEINEAYNESIQAIQHGKIDTGSFLNYYNKDAGMGAVKYDTQKEEELQRALRLGDKETAYDVINEIFAGMINQEVSRDNAIPILLQIVNSIVIEAQSSGIGMDAFRDDVRQIYPVILDYHDLNRVRKYIKFNLIDPVIYRQNELIDNQAGTIMAAIEQLVESREGNITLNECSEILSYHTSYIWRILKEEKNLTFSEYIEQYKIKLAKKLLTETDMTVGAIAEKLNYTNAQNFIRFFNKVVGTTPGKYRQAAKNNL